MIGSCRKFSWLLTSPAFEDLKAETVRCFKLKTSHSKGTRLYGSMPVTYMKFTFSVRCFRRIVRPKLRHVLLFVLDLFQSSHKFTAQCILRNFVEERLYWTCRTKAWPVGIRLAINRSTLAALAIKADSAIDLLEPGDGYPFLER